MSGSASDQRLLAVPYREGSLSPWALAEAATDTARLLWLLDEHSRADRSTRRLLYRLGEVADLTDMAAPARVDAIASARADGIVVFSDNGLVEMAGLSADLGLRFHSVEVARRLVDKHLQREALAAHGIAVPRHWTLPPDASDDDVRAVAAQASFPVVVKPQRGADSRYTSLARDAPELSAAVAAGGGLSTIVEEYLGDIAPALGDAFANYLSVETMVCAGRVSHVATTGRLPPAPPFRETGFFLPSTLSGSLRDEVLGLAGAAVAALGVEEGFLHTEIKLTPLGPMIIEVNGRLGGGIPAMMSLASGTNLVRVAMATALGDEVDVASTGDLRGVAYRFLCQAPMWATEVLRVDGLERVAALEGVEAISLHRPPGSTLDWRLGNHDYVFSVLGLATDHDHVTTVEEHVAELVAVEYS